LWAKEAGYDNVDDKLEQGLRGTHFDSELILLCEKEGMAFALNDSKAKRFGAKALDYSFIS
jgi:hypothetical protein